MNISLGKSFLKTLGVDLGLTDALVTLDGKKRSPLKVLQKSLKKLKRRQKALSGKIKGSANRTKGKKIVGALHEKVRNQRLDAIHKITKALGNDNQVIIRENIYTS